MSSKNRIFESEMIIHGRRTSRTITSISYSVGMKQSFTEYLSPARDTGYQNAEAGKPVVDLFTLNRQDNSDLRTYVTTISYGFRPVV